MEDAAREYNRLAEEHFDNPKVNIVSNSTTIASDLLLIEKLIDIDIMNLTIVEIYCIITINNWKEELKLNSGDINRDNIQFYKKIVIEKIVQYKVKLINSQVVKSETSYFTLKFIRK